MQYTIGLDLGGANTSVGIVNSKGDILLRQQMPADDCSDAEEYVDAVVQLLQPMMQQIGGRRAVSAMGIGAPCANSLTGCIEGAVNIPWAKNARVPLADMFNNKLHVPVAIANDANAATLGEMKFGLAKGMTDFIYLTLGTGIGSGIVSGGQLITGSDGMAGELGHMRVVPKGRLCACGRRGCLETYCSAKGIVTTAYDMLGRGKASSLDSLADKGLTAVDIFKAACRGDQVALDIFARTGRILGEACAEFTTFTSPEAFIFYGGLSHAWDFLVTPIRQAYYENVLPMYRGHCRFLVSNLRDADVAILGAAAVAQDKYYDEDIMFY